MLLSEKIAMEFHETNEKLSEKKSVTPWEKLPLPKKNLMIAVVKNLQRRGVISAGSKIKRRVPVRK